MWEIGKKRELKTIDNPQLCSKDVFHGYKNLNLGLLLNPIHADLINFKILECEGEIAVKDYGKLGTFSILPIKELKIPEWYVDIEIRKKVIVLFSILCAEAVLPNFENSYPEDDRPRKAIEAAKKYLNSPSKSVRAAAGSAVRSAESAVSVARSAARSAESARSAVRSAESARSAVRSAESARSAVRAARSVVRAAESVVRAAESAAESTWSAAQSADKKKIDFSKIADKAVNIIS